jgi:hypothetical protein
MKRKITHTRDIDEIEEQLRETRTGVLCIYLANEKLMQTVCNFIYLDKNIYFYLDNTEENFENIKYGSAGIFSTYRNEKLTTRNKEFNYKFSSITINGEIKDIAHVAELYRSKYSPAINADDYKTTENYKLIILDTIEIKSLIEEGI